MKHSIMKCLIGLLFIVILPELSMASDGKPLNNISFKYSLLVAIQDTIPPDQTSVKTDDKKEKKIKELPKSRKQPVPVPVNVKVVPEIKPIIKPIIKPVIKPVIKILH